MRGWASETWDQSASTRYEGKPVHLKLGFAPAVIDEDNAPLGRRVSTEELLLNAGRWLITAHCNECMRTGIPVQSYCALHRVVTCHDCNHCMLFEVCRELNAVWLIIDDDRDRAGDMELQQLTAWQCRAFGITSVPLAVKAIKPAL